MDSILTPAMVSAALTKLLDSAATQAGSKAWDALKAIVSRHRGQAPEQPTNPEEAAALADELTAAAEKDPALARDLSAWHQSIVGSDNTMNNVSGSAERVVQGRDFPHANITFN